MKDNIKITFNDGSVHEYSKGVTYYDISKDCKLDNIVAYKIDNEVFPLDKKALFDETIEFINTNDSIGNKIYKSGLKFLFQVALEETFPDLHVSFEHSVPRGMLGEVNGDKILNESDVALVKKKMREIVSSDDRITKMNLFPKDVIKYYFEIGEYEKAYNIQNISDKVVSLYKLHDKLNYFYSLMPYSTGVLKHYELVYLGNNRIIFLFPTVNSNGNVMEYVHYDKIIDAFFNSKKWLNELHMPYISDLNRTIGNRKIKNLIESNEIVFNMNISKVVEEIITRREVKFVLIAGPSSSGKTTTCKRMSSYFEALGYNTISISLDDYFLPREESPKHEDGSYDFECLEALRVDDFNNDLNNLLAGKEVVIPKYNFFKGAPEDVGEKVRMHNNTIFLIEGLHAINNELTDKIDDKYKYKIYLSPFIPINIDKHNYISTLDLRLLRRIVRDNRTRGYSVIKTMECWQSVRDGEEKNIFPFIHQADTIINTALAYEVGVLKTYVEPLLFSVSVDSKYFEEARRLIDFLKPFFPIPGEFVNNDSILREFIGGMNND